MQCFNIYFRNMFCIIINIYGYIIYIIFLFTYTK